MLDKLPRPVIFAHRGASTRAPENTLAAFRLAESEGADAIELDVQLSADGRVVVFHDATLERTTNGHGRLSEMALSALREFEVRGPSSESRTGEHIPLLQEVFEEVGGRLLIDIEFKHFSISQSTLVERVCELVKQHALTGKVIFSSFLASHLAQAERLLQEVPRALLARRGWAGAWARSFAFSFGDYSALHAFVADVNPRQVRRVHRLKRRIHAWPVTQAQQVKLLADWGVDGLFTADPRMALAALGRRT